LRLRVGSEDDKSSPDFTKFKLKSAPWVQKGEKKK